MEGAPCNDVFHFRAVGRVVESWFKNKNGTPRQPALCEEARGVIDIAEMTDNFPKITNAHYSLETLDDFSHVWLIFLFHGSSTSQTSEFTKTKVKPPRLGGQKVGVFSSRSPHRPNLVGLTLAKLERVEGTKIHVSGIDLIQGTPVLDIKPYIPHYDAPRKVSGPDGTTVVVDKVRIPEWITETPHLKVLFTERALASLNDIVEDEDERKCLKLAISAILSEDPRSVYRKEKCPDRLYFFTVKRISVTSWFDYENGVCFAEVLSVRRKSESKDDDERFLNGDGCLFTE